MTLRTGDLYTSGGYLGSQSRRFLCTQKVFWKISSAPGCWIGMPLRVLVIGPCVSSNDRPSTANQWLPCRRRDSCRYLLGRSTYPVLRVWVENFSGSDLRERKKIRIRNRPVRIRIRIQFKKWPLTVFLSILNIQNNRKKVFILLIHYNSGWHTL